MAHKRSLEELPHIPGQGQWPRLPGCDSAGAATPRPRSAAVTERSSPTLKQKWLHGRRRA